MREILKALGACTLLVIATVAAAPSEAPEEVVIDAAQSKKSAMTFPHKAHLENVSDCVVCHHQQEGLTADADMDVKPCTSCHLDPEKEDTPSMREMSLKKNPFHMLCVDCHKTEKKGPSKCNDCHPKAEAAGE